MANPKSKTGNRKSKDLYCILFEAASEAMLVVEAGQVAESNASALTLFGCKRKDLLGQRLVAFAPPDQLDGRVSAKAWSEKVEAALVGEPQQFEWLAQRLDGQTFYAEVRLQAVEMGDRTLLQVSMQDITERVQLEQQIQESLARRERQVQTSTEVAQEIAAAPALDELFRQVVDLVQTRFDYYHAHVYTLEEDNLMMQEGTGEAGRQMKKAGHQIALTTEQSLVARAARSGQPVLVPDVSQEPGWLPNPLLPETKAELTLPIKLGDEVLGVLDVQSDTVNGLSEEDQLLLLGLCGQIAVAIDSRRAEAERRQVEMALAKRVSELNCLNAVGREIAETPPIPGLLQWVTERIPPAMQYPELCRVAIEYDGQVYGQPEAIELSRHITNALRVGGRVMGRVYIAYTEKRDFLDEESALLGGIATRLGGYIENRRLVEQTQQRATALEEATRFLDSVVENIPSGLVVKDAQELKFVEWNKANEALTGLKKEEVVGKTDYDFFPKEEADFFTGKDREVLAGGQLIDIPEEPIHTAREGLRLLHTRKVPILGADGQPKYLLSISEDITERKQMEEALAKRISELNCLNETGREIAETPPVPDLLQWVTERIPPAMQYPALCRVAIEYDDQVYGQPEAIELSCHIANALRAGDQVMGRVYIAYTEKQDFLDEESALLGGIATRLGGYIENRRLYEQTQQRAAELEETTSFLNSILANIPSGIFVKEAQELRFVEWNRASEEVTGLKREEVIGKNDYDFFPQEEADFFTTKDREVLNKGEMLDIPEEPIHTADKGTRLVHTRKVPILGPDGKPRYMLGILEDITERKEAETKLRESEARFRDVALSSADWIWEVDAQGRYTYCSERVVNVLGYTAEEMLGKTPFELMVPEEAERIGPLFAEIATNKQPLVDLENRNLTKDGREVVMLTSGVPILDEAGNLLGYRGVDQDITEQKQAEAERERLLAEVQRLAAIVENHPDFIGVGTLEGQTLYVNPSGLRMMGLPPDYDVTTMEASDFYPPEDAEKLVKAGLPAALEQGFWSSEANLLRVDGTTIPVEQTIGINYDAQGKAYSFSITMHDITNRKVTAEALRVSEERFALSVQGSAEGIWDWDIANNTLYWSPRMKELVGYADDELDIDFDIFASFLHPEDAVSTQAALDAHLKERVPYDIEQRLRHKSGQYRWFRVRGQAIWDEAGRPLRMAGSSADITPRKEAEAERERLLADLSRLSAVVENTSDFVGVATLDGQVMYVNPAGMAMVGRAGEDYTGLILPDFQGAKGSKQMMKEALPTAMQEGTWAGESTFQHVDGSLIPVSQVVMVIRNEAGEPVSMATNARDVSDQKEAEVERERLLSEVQRLATIVENHPDFIGVGTLDGKALYVNPSGLTMMGLPPDHDVTTMDASNFYPPADAEMLVKEGVPTALEKGFWSSEANLLKVDGTTLPVEQVIGINYDAEGNPYSFSITMHDISNRKEAEVERERLLAEVQAAYRQFVRREWEQFLGEQHQGRWRIEHQPIDPTMALQSKGAEEQESDGTEEQSEIQNPQSKIEMPIALRGQAIGSLSLEDIDPDRTWTAEEKALIESVSEQLALTVENLRLFEDTQQSAVREQLTREITDKLRAAPDVDSIINTGLTELAKVLGVSRTYVKLTTAKLAQTEAKTADIEVIRRKLKSNGRKQTG